MTDKFSKFYNTLETSATDAFAISPSDVTELTAFPKSLYIGGAGNISVVTLDDSTVTLTGLPVGTLYR